jgi:hypothetical protein
MPPGINPFFVMEAIYSVALSHEEGCKCLTCRAAGGDDEAVATVFALIQAEESE